MHAKLNPKISKHLPAKTIPIFPFHRTNWTRGYFSPEGCPSRAEERLDVMVLEKNILHNNWRDLGKTFSSGSESQKPAQTPLFILASAFSDSKASCLSKAFQTRHLEITAQLRSWSAKSRILLCMLVWSTHESCNAYAPLVTARNKWSYVTVVLAEGKRDKAFISPGSEVVIPYKKLSLDDSSSS